MRYRACRLLLPLVAGTSDGAAWCWGFGFGGQLDDGLRTGPQFLGNGGGADGDEPVAVSGGRQFATLRAGFQHTCALTANGAAFCGGGGIGGGRSASRESGDAADRA